MGQYITKKGVSQGIFLKLERFLMRVCAIG